jgi:AraC-like DNA-binding protein
VRGLHSLAPFAAERVVTDELVAPVAYDWVELILLRSGVGWMASDCGRSLVGPGQAILLLANTPAGLMPDGRLEYTRLAMDTDWLVDQLRWVHPEAVDRAMLRWRTVALASPERAQVLDPDSQRFSQACCLADQLEEMTALGTFSGDPWTATALMTGVLGWLAPSLKGPRSRVVVVDGDAAAERPSRPRVSRPVLRPEIARARTLILENHDTACTLPWLAREVSLSPGYLWRLFTEQIGKTPKAYRDMARVMEMSRRLVARPDVPWPVIAREVGWTNKRSAAAAFEAGTTMTPVAYRRMLLAQAQSGSPEGRSLRVAGQI